MKWETEVIDSVRCVRDLRVLYFAMLFHYHWVHHWLNVTNNNSRKGIYMFS